MLSCSVVLERPQFTIRAEFSVRAGETLCLFGPSGSGKTSVLSSLAGIERAAGTIVWDQTILQDSVRDIFAPPWARQFGLVTQDNRLFPHMTIRQNLAFGLRKTSRDVVDEWANRLGLTEYLGRYPRELSGGLAQRVQLARALAPSPSVLLLDEPFSAIDTPSRQVLHKVIRAVRKEYSLAIVLVTHDLAEAQRLADRLAILNRGKILDCGSIDRVMSHPATIEVANMLGYQVVKESLFWDSGNPEMSVLVHPDRVRFGSFPEQGMIVMGRIVEKSPFLGAFRVQFVLASGAIIEATCAPWDRVDIGETYSFTIPLLRMGLERGTHDRP